jgi:heme exporter protein C
MKGAWWKILGIIMVLYAIVGGLLLEAPMGVGMLDETIRNLFYHVPMWFAMITLLLVAMIFNITFLASGKIKYFFKADALVKVAILLGVLGLATGAVWAKATWGAWWTKDPKLNGAAIGVFIYLAYLLLSEAIDDKWVKSRVLSVYNIFIYPIFIALIVVMPKLVDFSMHPGSGDTVMFNTYDLNNQLRMVFYPAVVGWILLAVWMADLTARYTSLKERRK